MKEKTFLISIITVCISLVALTSIIIRDWSGFIGIGIGLLICIFIIAPIANKLK